MGKAAVSLASDPEFRSALYSEIEKQFDGEYNVLFETLSEKVTSDKLNFGKRMSASSRTEDDFFKAQHAFKGIDGEDFFPQIYIPFYDELKEKQKNNTRILSVENDPVIVIFTGDEAQEVFPGYRLNSEGELEETDFLVDEDYARNNEVWVISINERFFGNEEVVKTEETNNQRIQASPSAAIVNMTLKCHNETWAAGASEVHIISVFSDWGFEKDYYWDYGHGPHEGGEVYKFSRKAVKNEWNKLLHFNIMQNWDDNISSEMPLLNYALFEYDSWPTGVKIVRFEHNARYFEAYFRSDDGPYVIETIHRDSMDGLSLSNDCIAWTFQYR